MSFARLLPKLIALPPPDCSWRMKKKNRRKRKTSGRYWSSTVTQSAFCSGFWNDMFTPFSRSFSAIEADASIGPVVTNFELSRRVPR
jgi:hypothetical protein